MEKMSFLVIHFVKSHKCEVQFLSFLTINNSRFYNGRYEGQAGLFAMKKENKRYQEAIHNAECYFLTSIKQKEVLIWFNIPIIKQLETFIRY